MSLETGTIVAGRYEVLGPLGHGGMGEVFEARVSGTGRLVAIKVLHAFVRDTGESSKRFRREARAAGMIVSDHVAQVLDVDEDPEHGLVLVFELLIGETLQARIKRGCCFDWPSLSQLVEQTLRGLADAHAAGIVHRDLKPSNVFLERRPNNNFRVKILDFGISKLPAELARTPLTRPDQAIGSLMFMPPEQLQGAASVDQRADLYSLGTVMFLILTGELPFPPSPLADLLSKKRHSEPRSLSEVAGKPFDPALEAWVRRALARAPEQRFQSAMEALSAWWALGVPIGRTEPNARTASSLPPRSSISPHTPELLARKTSTLAPSRNRDLFTLPCKPGVSYWEYSYRHYIPDTLPLSTVYKTHSHRLRSPALVFHLDRVHCLACLRGAAICNEASKPEALHCIGIGTEPSIDEAQSPVFVRFTACAQAHVPSRVHTPPMPMRKRAAAGSIGQATWAYSPADEALEQSLQSASPSCPTALVRLL